MTAHKYVDSQAHTCCSSIIFANGKCLNCALHGAGSPVGVDTSATVRSEREAKPQYRQPRAAIERGGAPVCLPDVLALNEIEKQ